FGERVEAVGLLGLLVLVKGPLPEGFHASTEAVGFVGQPHFFHGGEAGIGDMQKGVLFRTVQSHVVFAATAGVNKLDLDFLPNAFQITVAPNFKRKSLGLSAAFFRRTCIGAAGWMGFNTIRLPVHDVHAATIGPPSGNACRKPLGSIGQAAIVLIFVFVFFGVRGGIAALPESFDKLVTLSIGGQLFEGRFFIPGDDPTNIFFQPFLVIFAHFFGL